MSITKDRRNEISKIIIGTRICLRCGEEFGVNVFQHRKCYCDQCKNAHRIEYLRAPKQQEKARIRTRKYREKNYKPKRHKNQCERCGKLFTVGSGRKPTICIECLKKSELNTERRRADYRRNYDSEEQIRIQNQYFTPENKTAV